MESDKRLCHVGNIKPVRDVSSTVENKGGCTNGGSIVMGAHWNTQNTSKIHQNPGVL